VVEVIPLSSHPPSAAPINTTLIVKIIRAITRAPRLNLIVRPPCHKKTLAAQDFGIRRICFEDLLELHAGLVLQTPSRNSPRVNFRQLRCHGLESR
jgi:hypothetical protein